MPRLLAIEGPLEGQTFELKGEVVLGRLPECTIPLPDASVSRRHARLQVTPEGVYIEDLNTSNGTNVNGQCIASRTLLHDQDVVEVSTYVFRFIGEEKAGAQAPCVSAAAGVAPAVRVPGVLDLGMEVREDGSAGKSAIEKTLDLGATMVGGVFQPSDAGDQAKANERLRKIVQISSAIQAELELKVLLNLVLDNVLEVFRLADRGFLMLYDEGGQLQPAASRNRQGKAEKITISRSIVAEVTSRHVAVLSSDAMADQRFSGAVSIASYNIRSMMCAPLIAKGKLLGIIHVDTMRPNRKFTEDDLELLGGVAAQTALAIASARMHERLLVQDRVERDLKIATEVQTSFLPASTPKVEGMGFAAFYRAAQDIGGDLYDFIPLPGGSTMVVIGDVAGKGIPAALFMARVSSDVRFYSVQEREPKDVLPHVSQRMGETGMDHVFVTMVLVRVDPKTHEVVVANAAHCSPLVRRAAEGDVIKVGGEAGFPLGIMPDVEYTQSSYALQPGDVLCLVTDGVTEAMDAGKNQYGEDRLMRTVAAAPPSAKGVLDAVLEDVKAHVGGTKQSDDLTCVCFGVESEDDLPVLELAGEA